MAQTIVIATPSYVTKRGLSSILKDIEEVDIIYFDEPNEVTSFLEDKKADCIIIGQYPLLINQEWDLFFHLKEDAITIAITNEDKKITTGKKFDYVISREGSKEEIVPILNKVMGQKKEKKDKTSLLSERETEILKLVALGFTNQQIAEKLYISKHTVISHRKNITAKLGIKTVSGLTVYAVLNNLIPKDQIQ